MKIKNLIHNLLFVAGIILFAECGGYCDAGNFVGAVISFALCIACFYLIKKDFERNEARKKVVPYRYNIERVEDGELPKAQ